MNNHEQMESIRPPIFNGNNLSYWKIRARAYLQSLGANVWAIVEGGYQYPAAVLKDPTKKESLKTMPKLSMHYWEVYHNQNLSKSCSSLLNIAKAIWDKII